MGGYSSLYAHPPPQARPLIYSSTHLLTHSHFLPIAASHSHSHKRGRSHPIVTVRTLTHPLTHPAPGAPPTHPPTIPPLGARKPRRVFGFCAEISTISPLSARCFAAHHLARHPPARQRPGPPRRAERHPSRRRLAGLGQAAHLEAVSGNFRLTIQRRLGSFSLW